MAISPEKRRAILSRVARGYLLVTHSEKGPQYSYDDGTVAKLGATPIEGDRVFKRLVKEGALVPIRGETLFPETDIPQRYRARTVADDAA